MFQCGARILSKMHAMIVVLCLACFCTNTDTAYGETLSARAQHTHHLSISKQINNDIQCTDQRSDNSFCSLRTELRYHHYLNTPLTSHEQFSYAPSESDQPRADILAVFKLALEEFDLLSGVRIYYEYTERNLEEWAIKFRLKGEISISEPNFHTDGESPTGNAWNKSKQNRSTLNTSSKLRFLKPQKLKWNIGLNPDDMTVYGDLRINPYLSLNGEFGDENQVGLFFRYAF